MTLEEFKESKAYQYAEWAIAEENKPRVAEYIIKICEKFLWEIDNQDKIDYVFDFRMASKIMKLTKLINFSTGEVAGKSVFDVGAPFNHFLVLNIFCWKEKEDNDKRRYETCVLHISKKNNKSGISALFMILLMLLEPSYSDFFLCSNTKQQARIVYTETEKLIRSSPHIKKHFIIKKNEIICKLNNNKLEYLSSDVDTLDGRRSSGSVIDECGANSSGLLIESQASSMLSVSNRLLILISTSYPNSVNPFLDWCNYSKRVIDGIVKDERLFAMLYALNQEDFKSIEELDIDTMRKANPIQGFCKSGVEFLLAEKSKAKEMGSAKLTSFKTKHLNLWQSGNIGEEYINIADLQKCKIPKDSFSFYCKKVYCGFDMARCGDNTSFSIICFEDGNVYSKNFTFYPADKTEQKTKEEKFNYYESDAKGYSVPTGDIFVDIKEIFDFIIKVKEDYQLEIELFGYDARDCTGLSQMLESADIATVAVRQHSSTLGQPINLLEQYVLQGKFFYEENNILENNFSNAKCTYDTNNVRYINKRKSSSYKIDTIFSLLNALYLLNNQFINELEDNFCFQVV